MGRTRCGDWRTRSSLQSGLVSTRSGRRAACAFTASAWACITIPPAPATAGTHRIPGCLRFLDGPRMTELGIFRGKYRDEMLWGTYRPASFLGLRTRVHRGMVAGLMWFSASR